MIELRSIIQNKDAEKEVKKLYGEAFPPGEKMPYFILKNKAKKENADFYGVYDGDKFVGLLYCVKYRDILFVFYLAVSAGERGHGYGSSILNYVAEKFDKYRIVLNIEEVSEKYPDYQSRLKRKSFYEKNGFFTLDYQIKEGDVVYDMMCFSAQGNGVLQTEYYKLMENYLGKVLYKIYRFISR